MAKHSKKGDTKEIIRLKDYREKEKDTELRAEYEYEDEEEQAEGEKRLKKMRFPKAAYRVALILLALVLGLALWLNRESLTPQNVIDWVKLQVVGSNQGDGFPVDITGSQVLASNFASADGRALILSDTSYTVLDASGKELLSLRHDMNQPAMRAAYGKSLLYNSGSTGYLLLYGTETKLSGVADKEILAGDVAQNGRFALGLRGDHGASELQVFLEDGSLQYKYPFAADYITAVALNYDGTCGAVSTVTSLGGELISKVTVFDFNKEEPLASVESSGNFLVDMEWTERGDLYAVGESALLLASSSDYAFTEYPYDGRQITACCLEQGRAFVSISAYEHAGPSTLLIFHGKEEPLRVEFSERVTSLSVSGGTVGALTDGQALFYDYSNGMELGRASAGSDAKSIALGSESLAYVLGVSEVRTLEIK